MGGWLSERYLGKGPPSVFFSTVGIELKNPPFLKPPLSLFLRFLAKLKKPLSKFEPDFWNE